MSPGFADVHVNNIFSLEEKNWDAVTLALFRYQYQHNNLYHAYCNLMQADIDSVTQINQIPFIPISFFKTHLVHTTAFKPQLIFESSGTTSSQNSVHCIKDAELYNLILKKGFEHQYGDPAGYCFLALLPSYLEKGDSSLVYMCERLMKLSGHPSNGFYLDNIKALQETLQKNEKDNVKTILIGVTYALLDFADAYPMQLNNTLVMETGGMKGRKKEMTRAAVHDLLKKQLGVNEVHSEYGMTELLSQAYAKKDGLFTTPPWMKISMRKEDDPLDFTATRGVINIIDLGNIYSAAFIATDDTGILHNNGSFEVTGRLDNSDIRGCSLLSL